MLYVIFQAAAMDAVGETLVPTLSPSLSRSLSLSLSCFVSLALSISLSLSLSLSLSRTHTHTQVDLWVLDVEGAELEVLESVDFGRPQIHPIPPSIEEID